MIAMNDDEKDSFPINEKEVMDYYGYSGSFGRFKMKIKFLRGWILHSLHILHHYQDFQ